MHSKKEDCLFTLSEGESFSSKIKSMQELSLVPLFSIQILGRGYDYAYADFVKSISVSPGEIMAEIHGRSIYHTSLKREGRSVYGHCDCLFEGRCKHIAALLVYLVTISSDFDSDLLDQA